MIKLNVEQVIAMHSQLITQTGGEEGLRDIGLLQSAMLPPFRSYSISFRR